MPLISVVIPLYNKEPHIKRAIDSVLAQRVQDFEIIIVDDGSTDKSSEVVKSFTDSRIRLIQQKNQGVSATRNRGAKIANSDLIALLDADDEWAPTFLETIIRLNKKYPEAGMYCTAYNECKYGKIQTIPFKVIPLAPWEGLLSNYFLSAALGPHPVCSSSVCIPKDIYLSVGGFQVGVPWGEDDDFWGRIAIKYPVAFSQIIGATYYQDTTNRACNLQISVEHPFVKTAYDLINSNNVPQNMREDLRECIAKYQILSAAHNIRKGNPKVGKKILKSCDTKLLYRKKLFWIILSMVPPSTLRLIRKVKRKYESIPFVFG
jgi:glycosyltransferase involved in cell wall biosynthesis